jgi:hypothetical protein
VTWLLIALSAKEEDTQVKAFLGNLAAIVMALEREEYN